MYRRIDLARRTLAALPQLVALRPDSSTTVADRIEELARVQPERPFVVFGGDAEGTPPRTLSYGQLDAAANRVAAWALDRPLRPGSVVALLMESRPEYLVMWAGLAKAGITTALVNTHLAGAALRHAFAAAGADTLIVGPECLDRFASTSQDLELPLDVWVGGSERLETQLPDGARDLDADLAQREPSVPDPRVREERRCGDDLFYIYTSGTTGLPKAARFSHRRFLGVGVGAAIVLRMDRDDVHYCALPLYHSAGGVMMVSTVLAAGATLALRRRFSAGAFWDDCRRFGATSFQYIGEFCRYLVNQPPREDDRDHRVRAALGNGLRADVWKRFQERFGVEEIIEFYGLTEGNVFFMNQGGPLGAVGRIPFGELGRRLSPARLVRVDVATGEPLRDARGLCAECGVEEPGELLGRIPSANDRFSLPFEGYTSAEATRKKILRDVFASGDSWFRTGDLLRRDRDGWFYFVDRLGDTFRWKGENVSTQEVTRILGEFPGVALVTVYGVEVEGHEGRAGMAALALHERDAFDPQAFHAFVRERLPAYAAPLFLRLSEELSVTGTFKLRKVDLVKEGFDESRISEPLFFRDDDAGTYTPLTKKLRRQILGGERRV